MNQIAQNNQADKDRANKIELARLDGLRRALPARCLGFEGFWTDLVMVV